MSGRPRVGVSACLLGRQVRYDGDHKRDAWVAGELARAFELVPVCPEVELGLGVPRDPIRLVTAPTGTRLVCPRTGRDLTTEMSAWAETRVRALAAERLAGFVLKAASPSCGPAAVKVFASSEAETPASLDGTGFFARALLREFPDMPIADETALATPAARQSFVESVMVYCEKKIRAAP
jgi:uncharacterized protein YbbK (DUF523 family)